MAIIVIIWSCTIYYYARATESMFSAFRCKTLRGVHFSNFKSIQVADYSMSPSVIGTHVCLASTGFALGSGRFFLGDGTPRHDPAIRLDLRVWAEIVVADHTFEFSNTGVAERAVHFITGIGCLGLLDLGVVVVRLDVVDRLFLQVIKGGRLAVRLVCMREMGQTRGAGVPLHMPRRG